MKGKWYRSNGVKTVLLIVEHVSAALLIASILCVCAFPYIAEELVTGRSSKTYEDSLAFEECVETYAWQILGGISYQNIFETNGTYDSDKLVDIQEFYQNGTVTGKNKSGLAFRLGDLLDSDAYCDEYDSADEQIVVCQKANESYQYYMYEEFESKIENGELQLDGFLRYKEDYGENARALNYLVDREYDVNRIVVRGKNDKKLYENCWLYEGSYYRDAAKPDGEDSILDLVNHNKNWNGHLNDIYRMYGQCVETLQQEWEEYSAKDNDITEGNTNLRYVYINNETERIDSNVEKYHTYASAENYMDELKDCGRYVIVRPTLEGFESNIPKANAAKWEELTHVLPSNSSDYTFMIAVNTEYPVQDGFYTESQNYAEHMGIVKPMIYLGILGAVLFAIAFIWLTIIAGRTDLDEEIHLNRFDHWKTELAAAVSLGSGLIIAMLGGAAMIESGVFAQGYQSNLSWGMVMACVAGVTLIEVVAYAILFGGYLSLVRRIKAGTLWKDSLLRKLVKLCGYLFENLHSMWKITIIYGGFTILLLLTSVIFWNDGRFLTFLVLLAVVCAGAAGLVIYAIGREKIKQGIIKIASGDVDYKIPTEKMLPDQKVIAEHVNRIGEGLDAAVEKSLKSERLKTDLITNVSHDIKTPLTSIINYVDLLKKENFEDARIQRYLEILEQKSQRLKNLTEDVVEASKVSSGNISLEFMRINFVEMVQQTSGEFEEKFEKRRLTEILTLPEEEVVIRVDGRRTWRILENIYNNAAKYAMEGSRVYADLRVEDTNAVFTLKNISEQPLNISADELTERFIRGDVSRSTEGSGLGLSIAQNLTQLQGGKFEIYLDGDLFKVTVTFPMV